MTAKEAKDALMDGRPVVYREVVFKKVSAIIYRNVNGQINVTVELLDRNGFCVVIAPVERVEAA